jgi:hypothetical protein
MTERNRNRVKFTMEFEVDLDMVPGFGHQPDDWKKFIVNTLAQQVPHYNPTIKMVAAELKCMDGKVASFRYLNDAEPVACKSEPA